MRKNPIQNFPKFNQLQTNFNSIVNSEIELTKIFIELTIPKKLIDPKSINHNKENDINTKSEKSEEEPKYYIPPPPPFLSQNMYIPPPPPAPASWANLNLYSMRFGSKSEIPIPPPFHVFNNLKYKKDFNSKNYNTLRNQLVYNNKFPKVTFDYISINNNYHKSPSLSIDPIKAYSSPTSASCNYSPMSASYSSYFILSSISTSWGILSLSLLENILTGETMSFPRLNISIIIFSLVSSIAFIVFNTPS